MFNDPFFKKAAVVFFNDHSMVIPAVAILSS